MDVFVNLISYGRFVLVMYFLGKNRWVDCSGIMKLIFLYIRLLKLEFMILVMVSGLLFRMMDWLIVVVVEL